MSLRLTKDFELAEFVPKSIYDVWGDRSIIFIDPRLPQLVQAIRNMLGKPITLNTWHNGGNRIESGFRESDTTTGAKYSQHKFGRAADLHCAELTPTEIFDAIQNNFEYLNKLGLTTCENISMTPTWNHVDMRFTNSKGLLIVNP